MTPQEIFNKSYLGLLKQGCKAAEDDYGNGCMYRTPEGHACAVGLLIDDETAEEWDHYGGVKSVIEKLGNDAPEWLVDNQRLLCEMQSAHDLSPIYKADFLENIREAFARIAEGHNLEVPDA